MTSNTNYKIAIASGKGGTGKTLVSTSLFYSLQQNGVPVTLIDCDAEEPNDMVFFNAEATRTLDVTQLVPVIDESKCTYCGRCHDYCAYNAIFIIPPSKIIKVMEDLCHGCGACSVACNDGAITEKLVSLGEIKYYPMTSTSQVVEARVYVGVYSPVSVIKKAINSVDSNQLILMDSPPGTSCPFIQTVSHADYIILITEPTPFGLSDLKQSVDTLRTMGKACGVIINRAGLGDKAVYQYLEDEKIPLLMEIPFDRDIASIYSKGNIVAKEKPELQQKLIDVFELVCDSIAGR
ncbi:nucleotide-binding protein [Perlabentimonas gracilis]|uniref:nucleotide-binding protein n=1 Tax=Perlabentimonas gracilis TaxID=2715279 RepID=UPI00140CD81A|nr:ATP-binding protein [Perlabentimonas gracilis]NHB69728.1 P-loop NTPase [Perlabentimonas gracilis]